ncbi:MAG: hypothetical protein ACI83D_000321 [Planctomycetota bacterium]|jgi:hypothetical protein
MDISLGQYHVAYTLPMLTPLNTKKTKRILSQEKKISYSFFLILSYLLVVTAVMIIIIYKADGVSGEDALLSNILALGLYGVEVLISMFLIAIYNTYRQSAVSIPSWWGSVRILKWINWSLIFLIILIS